MGHDAAGGDGARDGRAVETNDSDDSARSTSGMSWVELRPVPGAVEVAGAAATVLGVGRQLIHWHRLTWVLPVASGETVPPKNGSADDVTAAAAAEKRLFAGGVAGADADADCDGVDEDCNCSGRESCGVLVEEAE